jgi:hypothetical protein
MYQIPYMMEKGKSEKYTQNNQLYHLRTKGN